MDTPAFEVKNLSNFHFDLYLDADKVGYLNFSKDEGHFYLDYVYVSPAWRGHGVGQQIVARGLEMAAAAGLKPVGICGYAHAVMQYMNRNK